MRQRKPRSPRLSTEEKAELRRQLPALIESAANNVEARAAAVKACLNTQNPLPPTLLEPSVLATSLTGQELVAALSRLATSTIIRDLSAVLGALRNRLDRDVASGESAPQKLVRVATSVPRKVLRLAMADGRPRRQKPGRPQVLIAAPTIAAFADLAVWAVRTAATASSRTPPDPRGLAVPWIAAVDALWQRTPADTDARVLAQFWRDISSALGPAVLGSVKADPQVSAFVARKRDAVRLTATTAFQQGRLETLRSLEVLHANEATEWKDLLEQFRSACVSGGSSIPEMSIDWLARQSDDATRRHLAAADESQSSTIDYAAVALLAAWDAIPEGPRSREAYEAVRSMTQTLFKLELVGTPADIVPFDELQHDLLVAGRTRPATVKFIRPGIRWSDGVRSRTVVRATVEAV